MRNYRITYEDGNITETQFNGSIDDARLYYVGKSFTFGTSEENEYSVKAVDVVDITAEVKMNEKRLRELNRLEIEEEIIKLKRIIIIKSPVTPDSVTIIRESLNSPMLLIYADTFYLGIQIVEKFDKVKMYFDKKSFYRIDQDYESGFPVVSDDYIYKVTAGRNITGEEFAFFANIGGLICRVRVKIKNYCCKINKIVEKFESSCVGFWPTTNIEYELIWPDWNFDCERIIKYQGAKDKIHIFYKETIECESSSLLKNLNSLEPLRSKQII